MSETITRRTRDPVGTSAGARSWRAGDSVRGKRPCPWCGHFVWWRSVHGAVVCGECHPPAESRLAVEWIDGLDGQPGISREMASNSKRRLANVWPFKLR